MNALKADDEQSVVQDLEIKADDEVHQDQNVQHSDEEKKDEVLENLEEKEEQEHVAVVVQEKIKDDNADAASVKVKKKNSKKRVNQPNGMRRHYVIVDQVGNTENVAENVRDLMVKEFEEDK